jgi:tetratricopeptide (TPR) repeat protein
MADYRNALNIIQKLAAANPGDKQIQRDLAGYGSNLGRLLARQNQFAEAFKTLDASLAIRKKLTEMDPNSTDFAGDLAESFANRGWARVHAGQTVEAADDLRRAIDSGTRFRLSISTRVSSGAEHLRFWPVSARRRNRRQRQPGRRHSQTGQWLPSRMPSMPVGPNSTN